MQITPQNPFAAPTASERSDSTPTRLAAWTGMWKGSISDLLNYPRGMFLTGLRLYFAGLIVGPVASILLQMIFLTLGLNWDVLAPAVRALSFLVLASTICSAVAAGLLAATTPRHHRLAIVLAIFKILQLIAPRFTPITSNNYWIMANLFVDGAIKLIGLTAGAWLLVKFSSRKSTRRWAGLATAGSILFCLLAPASFYFQVVKWPDITSRYQGLSTIVGAVFLLIWIAVSFFHLLVAHDALATQTEATEALSTQDPTA